MACVGLAMQEYVDSVIFNHAVHALRLLLCPALLWMFVMICVHTACLCDTFVYEGFPLHMFRCFCNATVWCARVDVDLSACRFCFHALHTTVYVRV